ncbi:hypothetical protein JG688_00014426 [Phytophthora aleatoria]|uniref:Uncharacterized protein n=1 Tax=Phytophthora aleatoria TaxID=2496075 RepID=A0A8J5IBW8_9STRA|nr:hypothetical protein JG688_00014426 [Phytophthora aleatoria]
MTVKPVASKENFADLLTKLLPVDAFMRHRAKLGGYCAFFSWILLVLTSPESLLMLPGLESVLVLTSPESLLVLPGLESVLVLALPQLVL